MIIYIDTREKKPLIFPADIETERIKLNYGDYQATLEDNHIVPVVFERKGSLSDLWKTLTIEHSRLKKEIERAKIDNVSLILIIEGSLSKILKGFSRSEVKGISIIKTLFSLWCRYNIMPVFCKDKFEMATYITHYYSAYARKYFSKEKRT